MLIEASSSGNSRPYCLRTKKKKGAMLQSRMISFSMKHPDSILLGPPHTANVNERSPKNISSDVLKIRELSLLIIRDVGGRHLESERLIYPY